MLDMWWRDSALARTVSSLSFGRVVRVERGCLQEEISEEEERQAFEI